MHVITSYSIHYTKLYELDVRASDINDEMKLAAAEAIAQLIAEDELSRDYIIPDAFDARIGEAVAQAVRIAAKETGVNRI